VEVIHDGFDLSDRAEIFLLRLKDELERRISEDLLAKKVFFSLVVIIAEMFGDQLVFDELVLVFGHVEFMGHE